MSAFLDYLATHAEGILLLLLCLVAVLVLVQWFCWIFRVGRFGTSAEAAAPRSRDRALRYVFSEAMVKIINDFRHLLALVIVLIFAGALAYALDAATTHEERLDALQGVAAALGGLVGSIIGYYFGESAAQSTVSMGGDGAGGTSGPSVQPPPLSSAPTGAFDADFEEAPEPKPLPDEEG